MTTADKRERLHYFIEVADDQQLRAMHSIFQELITPKYDHWEDEEFLNEIDKRIHDFESGKDKGLSWEEVKTKAKERLKKY